MDLQFAHEPAIFEKAPWRVRFYAERCLTYREANAVAQNPASQLEEFERVLSLARTGSTKAIGELLDLPRQYLLLVANRQLGTALQAKLGPSDVVQESLMEAHRDFQQFHGNTEADILAWLRRILLNNIANAREHYRFCQKRAIGREVPLDQLSGGAGCETIASTGPSPSKVAAAGEQNTEIEQAVAQLPVLYQEALRLIHRENCSFEEMGQRMDRSSEAARKLWARAVEQLKLKLKPSDDRA
ncbi:sigma-70 family RNA polymerase sigma factor [soil metagenome]